MVYGLGLCVKKKQYLTKVGYACKYNNNTINYTYYIDNNIWLPNRYLYMVSTCFDMPDDVRYLVINHEK